MNTTKSQQNVTNSSVTTKLPLNSFWHRLSIRHKIMLAFSSLLIMAIVSTTFTLLKIATVEKNSISMIESQGPMTVKMLLLSQNINHAISLLNQIINTNRTDDKILYAEIETQILSFASELSQGEYKHIRASEIEKIQHLLDGFTRHAATVIDLSDDFTANFPGIAMASEKLAPLALSYLGLVNEILGRDDSELNVGRKQLTEVRHILGELRYTWVQVMNHFRMNFINQLVKKNSITNNLDLYLEENKKLLSRLIDMKVDLGVGDVEQLQEAYTEYVDILPEVIKIQTSVGWRTDMKIMDVKIKPIAAELRSLLNEQVHEKVSSTMNSGSVVISNLRQIRTYTTVLLAVAIIIGLMVGWVILRAIIPPLEKLVLAADQVSNGELNSEVFVYSNDEIGQLSRSFNRMVDHLREGEINKQDYLNSLEKMNLDLEVRVAERTVELEQSETRIRTVHDSVGEGIVVIGKNFQIETINRAALKMFKNSEKNIIGKQASILFSATSDTDKETVIDTDRFTQLTNSHETTEVEGVRANGERFPMDMLVTKMTIASKESFVCIVRDITSRKQAEQRLLDAQNEIVNAAHKSGMAEMATGVLHNIGNILNSVNISVEEVARVARNSKIVGLVKANSMLADNMNNIAEFIANDSKGSKLPGYYIKLGKVIEDEFNSIASEVSVLSQKTTMMKEVISTQQSYATAGFLSESFDIAASIDDALVVQKSSLDKWGVRVDLRVDELPLISAQKSRVLQVITNLIKNAKEAMQDNDDYNKAKLLTITAGIHNSHSVYVCVSDTGCGVSEENLSKIFQHGFTTKDSGHGFGLHASANAMTEMGGTLTIRSEGVGKGSDFTLILPVANYAHVGSSADSGDDFAEAV